VSPARLLLGCLIVLVPALVGCGGAESESSLAAAALERTEARGTFRMSARIAQANAGRDSAVECAGSADYEHERFQISCGDWGETRVIGDSSYVRGAGIAGFPTAENRWVRVPNAERDRSFAALAPSSMLQKLRRASIDTEEVAEEQVRGVPTVRYELTVSCERADLLCADETTTVGVWVDEDGLVRRISTQEQRTSAILEFFDFGVEVDIVRPRAEDVAKPQDLEPKPCTGGGAPIADERATRALRRNGFEIASQDTCAGGAAASFAGMSAASAGSNGRGTLVCLLYQRPPAGAPATVRHSTSLGTDRL
jgi:hypothetical protein